MENASKALIIAGAILISILLISAAIMVINATSGVTDQVQGEMDSLALQQFNGKFDPYIGSKKTAADVKGLISTITANNGVNTTHTVQIKYTGTNASGTTANISTATSAAADLAKVQGYVKVTKSYTMTVTGNTNGYYSEITIEES